MPQCTVTCGVERVHEGIPVAPCVLAVRLGARGNAISQCPDSPLACLTSNSMLATGPLSTTDGMLAA